MKRLFIVLSLFIFQQSILPADAEQIPSVLNQEIKQLLETDPDIKQRMGVEDKELADFIDQVDRCMVIAQKSPSAFRRFLDYFFYNIFPGAVLQSNLKGLIYLPPEKAPQLYAVVSELAEKFNIPTPPLFLAKDKKLYNAMASSFASSTAMVVLGRKLVEQLPDNELKIILAHELAHVKRNAVLKNLATLIASIAVAVCSLHYINKYLTKKHGVFQVLVRCNSYQYYIIGLVLGLAIAAILLKLSRYEEEMADREAIDVTNDPESFVAAMKSLSGYFVERIKKFLDDYEFLSKKIDTLAVASPIMASLVRESAQEYGRSVIATYKDALTGEDGDHPSQSARIAYGQELIERKHQSQPTAGSTAS